MLEDRDGYRRALGDGIKVLMVRIGGLRSSFKE